MNLWDLAVRPGGRRVVIHSTRDTDGNRTYRWECPECGLASLWTASEDRAIRWGVRHEDAQGCGR